MAKGGQISVFSVVNTISQSFFLSGRSDRLASFLFLLWPCGEKGKHFRGADQSPH